VKCLEERALRDGDDYLHSPLETFAGNRINCINSITLELEPQPVTTGMSQADDAIELQAKRARQCVSSSSPVTR
jgi:hypothetical protein